MFGFCECSRVSSELRCLLHDPRCCIYTWLKSLTLKSLRWRAWSANRATLQCIMMCHQKVPQRSMANLSVYHCPWPPFRAVQTTLALGGSPVVPQRSKRDKLAPRHSAEGYPSQRYIQVNLSRQDLLPIRLQHNLQLFAYKQEELCDNITIYVLWRVNALKPYCS
jgi:hypothetical protein